MTFNFTERQTRISGWRQDKLEGATVVVTGSGWSAAFVASGLALIGVKRVIWLGRAEEPVKLLRQWLAARQGGAQVIEVHDRSVEYAAELPCIVGAVAPVAVVACNADNVVAKAALAAAHEWRAHFVSCSGSGGGWTRLDQISPPIVGRDEPIASLAAAAQVVDSVRMIVSPLPADVLPPDGALNLDPSELGSSPQLANPSLVFLAGIGGIGTWSRTRLACRGYRLWAIDRDRVDATNLNRQCLFDARDAGGGATKAAAAQSALAAIFPAASVLTQVRDVHDVSGQELDERRPAVLVSALDNAASRLIVQSLGRAMNVPVVQGGTGTFAADVFCQTPRGPSLDDQLHGELSSAAKRERGRESGCGEAAYVAPSMMAAAMLAFRIDQIEAGRARELAPLRWRSGCLLSGVEG